MTWSKTTHRLVANLEHTPCLRDAAERTGIEYRTAQILLSEADLLGRYKTTTQVAERFGYDRNRIRPAIHALWTIRSGRAYFSPSTEARLADYLRRNPPFVQGLEPGNIAVRDLRRRLRVAPRRVSDAIREVIPDWDSAKARGRRHGLTPDQAAAVATHLGKPWPR